MGKACLPGAKGAALGGADVHADDTAMTEVMQELRAALMRDLSSRTAPLTDRLTSVVSFFKR